MRNASTSYGLPMLQNLMRDMQAIQRHRERVILCHPATLTLVAENIQTDERIDPRHGIQVHTSCYLPKTGVFSRDPFVQYENSDQWAVRLGLATEEPIAYHFEPPAMPLSAGLEMFQRRVEEEIYRNVFSCRHFSTPG